ncbi:MAG TPA: NifU family protein [Candidatus Manganitrophaceae bacterium]|nr:NifU family protein [Candidatus Manganitrophaceae bacterium]
MIEITDIAKKRILALKQDQEERQEKKVEGLRLVVKGMAPNVEYGLAFVEEGKKEPGEIVVETDGIKVFMEEKHRSFLEEVKIDFINNLERNGFKVDNPKVVLPTPEIPKSPPDLESPLAKAVQKVIETEINPAVRSHGGYITLIDVKEQIVYIQMGGGCQGCGMASVTLKQGVVTAIRKAVPEIVEVLDATDHAGGKNPYFTPGK